MLKKEEVEEFRQIYKARFGEELSLEDANEMGEQLVNLMQIIYRPIKRPQTNNP